MVSLRFLVLQCFILCSVILLARSTKLRRRPICRRNETYVACVNKCNTCVYKGNCMQTMECKAGCDCLHTYYRNSKGHCVPASMCDGPGPVKRCQPDEVYKECGCVSSCCNRGDPVACNKECLSGCFCRDDLVRDPLGNCIKPEDCPGGLPVSCKEDEQFYQRKPECKNTCENFDNPAVLCAIGTPGCFCKEGLVKRIDGKCVKPEDCNNEACGPNQEYLECGSACPDTCDNYGEERACTLQCVQGCFCKQGFVRNNYGECIKPEQCGQRICGKDETYYDCTPSCKNTCKNYNNPGVDCACGPPGCFCSPGLVKDEASGKCVKPEKCPAEPGVCPYDEVYKFCGSSCPPTCKNYGKPIICNRKCVPGCFCKDGLVRSDDGRCIIPERCPKEKCNNDEELKSCGSSCPDTCENYGKDRICTFECVHGCFCKRGLVRNSKFQCVMPEKCGKRNCNKDEVYKRCGTACPETCDNVGETLPCTKNCVAGCFCKKGLVRDPDRKKCIKPEKCRKSETCPGINEEVVPCAKPKFCNTCAIRGNCKLKTCNPGCDCKPGYYRDDNLICIPESLCPGKVPCGVNEEYNACGSACPPTCDSKTPAFCPTVCKSGCFCKKDFIRERKGGLCIPKNLCPREACGPNQEYLECGSACPDTCDNYGEERACTLQCVQGCFCKQGFVKNNYGECIKPEHCGQIPCGVNEEYNACGSACPPTCDSKTPAFCPTVCKSGCFCKKDFIRERKGGLCIPKNLCPREPQCSPPKCPENCEIDYNSKPCPSCKCVQCNIPNCPVGCKIIHTTKPCPSCSCDTGPIECSKDEEFVECVPCGNKCDTYEQRLYCKQACKPGCTCKDGLVKRKDGNCVQPEKCEEIPVCGQNEEPSDCVNPCNDCDTRGNCNFLVCNKGCDCKKGFFRNDEGHCMHASLCPKTNDWDVSDESSESREKRDSDDDSEGGKKECTDDDSDQSDDSEGSDSDEDKNPKYKKCGRNEVYRHCGTACPETCDNKGKPTVCTEQCVRGCFCVDGYVRNKEGHCVHHNQCEPPKVCAPDEEYYACTPDCMNKCNPPEVCPAICKPGCFCRKGLVLREEDMKCVDKSQCFDKKCRWDEEYYSCIPDCKNTCKNYGNPHAVCPFICRSGCFCKRGLVKSEDGRCVKPNQCPKVCGPNEIFSDCVNPCNNCEIRGKCQFFACNKGCDCLKGYYRNDQGKCIPAARCPKKKCGKNERYKYCGTACPETCKDGGKPPACSKLCVPGCFCEEGFVRNSARQCVPRTQCGKECGVNEQYYDCMPLCKGDCETYNKDVACRFPCRAGCFCKPGFVKRKDGKCVRPKECNNPECPLINCRAGCELDKTTKPCPKCKCPNECPLPKCRAGCVLDKTTKPCPKCKCPNEPECSMPKCGKDCIIDYTTHPCPSCKCDKTPVCPRIACRPPCQFIKNKNEPCPKCVCETLRGPPRKYPIHKKTDLGDASPVEEHKKIEIEDYSKYKKIGPPEETKINQEVKSEDSDEDGDEDGDEDSDEEDGEVRSKKDIDESDKDATDADEDGE